MRGSHPPAPTLTHPRGHLAERPSCAPHSPVLLAVPHEARGEGEDVRLRAVVEAQLQVVHCLVVNVKIALQAHRLGAAPPIDGLAGDKVQGKGEWGGGRGGRRKREEGSKEFFWGPPC